MPGRRAVQAGTAAQIPTTNIVDPTVSRAVDDVRRAAQSALDRRTFEIVPIDLVVGVNVVQHNLGRAPQYINVKPTVANATFAWAEHTDNPHPDRQVLIDVVGVAQPGASVFVS